METWPQLMTLVKVISGWQEESRELESAAVHPVFRGLAIRDNRGMSWFPGECACHRETFLKFNWEMSQHVCIRVQREVIMIARIPGVQISGERRGHATRHKTEVWGQGRHPVKSV